MPSSGEKLLNVLNAVGHIAGDGLFITDGQSYVLYCNRMAQHWLGMTTSDPVGQKLYDVVQVDAIRELYAKTENAETSLYAEIILPGEQGALSAHLVSTHDGQILTLHDVSDYKQVCRAKSAFVERLSRDIRSPLTAIRGYAELLALGDPLDAQQAMFLERMQFGIESVTHLVDGLTQLSELEADYTSAYEPTQLVTIVQYALEGAEKQIADAEIVIRAELPVEVPHMIGVPVRLREMVEHLLDNSVKNMPQGGTIDVSVSNAEEGVVLLVIRDNGIGIMPTDQIHVFDKFYRGRASSRLYPGSGLGLSIVANIVEQHNGRIWLESQEGQGTTFTVMFPTQNGHPAPNKA